MKPLLCLLSLLILFSCTPDKPNTEIADSEADMNAEQLTSETVRITGMSRPGGEVTEFDMPILKGHEAWDIVAPEESDIMEDELVLGMFIEDEPVALPIRHMSGFEVSNLTVGDESYLITWCPLVGSARLFSGEINGEKGQFDFGMGLVDNNLTIVDRDTRTVWGQLSCKSINGEPGETELEPLPTMQSTYSFWRATNPDTKVMINTDTSGAVFPQYVNERPQYTSWIPGEEYVPMQNHDLTHVGLGISANNESAFFDINNLFVQESPVEATVGGMDVLVYTDREGLTAWAETTEGELLPGTIVYKWAWENFYPDSAMY